MTKRRMKTVLVDEDLHYDIKVLALQLRITVAELVEQALVEWLNKYREEVEQ